MLRKRRKQPPNIKLTLFQPVLFSQVNAINNNNDDDDAMTTMTRMKKMKVKDDDPTAQLTT